MRLNKIKLFGFKSFVEQTTLTLPSNRVGVVGPNGCGKSNVIDAVRWVMGESSAKHLRGAAMLDVIFNGSATRIPSAIAAVELVFEDVTVPHYPPHSEISIRRELSRDGQSHYLINGIRCRRKDITDLFLGTGLGPRHYAIIEQGMITRLIEAKPDELRTLLEEAAGISKYKERRKETEQHIKQTKENLSRLDEVRNEIAQQLEKLQKQAKQAEKFQELKKSEQLLKAQLLAIRWYDLDATIQEQQQRIDEQADVLSKDLLSLHHIEATHKEQRSAQTIAHNALSDVQARYYTIEKEIARLEQTIAHHHERYQQLQWDLEQFNQTYDEVKQQLVNDEQQLSELSSNIEETEIELEEKQTIEFESQENLRNAETQLEIGQENWEDFTARAAEPTQRAQLERAHLQNLETRLEKNQHRLLRLEEERQNIDLYNLERIINELSEELALLTTELTQEEEQLVKYQQTVKELRDSTQELSARLHEQHTYVHQLSGRLASLEALQEAALGRSNADLTAWIHAHQLDHQSRLAQLVQVTSGWERAVEIVLGEALQALCMEDATALKTALIKPPSGHLVVFEMGKIPQESIQSKHENSVDGVTRLLDKITTTLPLESLLSTILAADTLDIAYRYRPYLAVHESIITQQGIRLGQNWIYSQQGMDEKAGILARGQEIDAVSRKLSALDKAVSSLSQELEQRRHRLREDEYHRDRLQQQVDEFRKKIAELSSQYSAKTTRLDHLKSQLQRITEETTELNQQLIEDTESIETARYNLHAALEEMETLAEEREQLQKQKAIYQETVEQARDTAGEAKDERHRVEMQLSALRTDKTRLQQTLTRLGKRIEQLREQQYELQENLEKQAAPLETLQSELAHYLQQRGEADEALLQAKQTVEHLDAALSHYEDHRHELETRSQALRNNLEQARLTCQADQVRKQTLEEQLEAMNCSPVALLAELPEYADEASWQSQIEAVERKLEKLGSVNLAALDECAEQSERKRYFDEQADDLNNALNQLENAIRTIDRETRTRFKHTLENVNGHLQNIFPRLFGGGQANLELTHEDILQAGVTIMARPPGKRNSTIHLLSGGEKTLTAIALVFSIFELNPAPFCMLDEVDAPLDDTNVGRFCELLVTLSERVQFIFITHNKLTMEIAEQLVGVTMHEAGVSRLVTVNVEQAVEMVGI